MDQNSRTTGPTEMIHLPIFLELNKEYHRSVVELTVQTMSSFVVL